MLPGLRRPIDAHLGWGLLGLCCALVAFLGAGVWSPAPAAPRLGPPAVAGGSVSNMRVAAVGNRSGAPVVGTPALQPATTPPVAAPATVAAGPPLAPRENFAFAPYWTLPESAGFTLTGLSTLAYFAVGVEPNGTLDESGPGWNGYESQALSTLITRAHAAGARVVLTVNDFSQDSLNALTSSPSAPATLAAALIPALQAKNFDGVNFDFEGAGSTDQAGLTHLISAVSGALKAADPHWQVTMDTYASSAGDPGGFFNIAALAPSVDAFFVMAYEMNLGATASPASPLTSGMFSDLTTLAQYTAAVPADKVILGAPFFGIDWPTDNGTMPADATGQATDIAEAQTQDSGRPVYWDPVTGTEWTSYLVGTQWHESYYEGAYGLYEVAQLAARYGVRGVGIWALGMEANQDLMIAALDGAMPPHRRRRALRPPPPRPRRPPQRPRPRRQLRPRRPPPPRRPPLPRRRLHPTSRGPSTARRANSARWARGRSTALSPSVRSPTSPPATRPSPVWPTVHRCPSTPPAR